MARAPAAAPKVGFVSLGCPKALVDSERVLTQLRAEGYATSKSYRDADLVIVTPAASSTTRWSSRSTRSARRSSRTAA